MMAIKHLTFSALTGGALVLAYAAWSKWRPAPHQPQLKVQPAAAPALEEASIDVALDDLWAADEFAPNPDEELVDFSSELNDDEDDVSVAPEGLGARWLGRATEAMSPFHRTLSVRDEAEAALLEGIEFSVEK
jgi:hypothetical protein